MSELITLKTIVDSRGSLTVIEKILPFEIARVYYIYGATAQRGGHRHIKTVQGFICIAGSCEIFIDDGINQSNMVLNRPDRCLVVMPQEWHTMNNFSKDAILLVLASEYYDPNDYIHEPYTRTGESE